MRLVLFSIVLAGCEPDIDFTGDKTSKYFPMEGTRIATFANEDQDTWPYNIVMTNLSPTETLDDRDVVTLEQRWDDDDQTLVGAVKWSVVDGGSTLIHAWEGVDGVWSDFDPPVSVTDPSGYMHTGDAVTTETGGTTFTSVYVEVVECDPIWGADWNDCRHFRICDSDEASCRESAGVSGNDPTTRPNFVGDYWLVSRYFTSWFWTAGYDTKWNLTNHDYAEEE